MVPKLWWSRWIGRKSGRCFYTRYRLHTKTSNRRENSSSIAPRWSSTPKRATDVPLTVLIYNRDTSRRLRNAEEVVESLKKSLKLTDTERHNHFPLTYTSERAPRKKPRLGIGSIKESRPGGTSGLRQGGGNVRRKKGGFITDHSSVKRYEDGDGKVQWQVELMTHNRHNSYNPHQGHLHDKASGKDTTIEESAHRADATHSKHHPSCNVIRAVREASVLITPHGFSSILLLFQPRNQC